MPFSSRAGRIAALLALLLSTPLGALESDRQRPLEVNADSTDGTLGDGITTLRGHVEMRQGSLLIRADVAEVDKLDGRVTQITLRGESAYLEQEIEQLGRVKAWARLIEYQVGDGLVVLSGEAEVRHPQYEVSGEQLRYDLDAQHFEGMGGDSGNGRIRIRLDPEVVTEKQDTATGQPADEADSGIPADGPGG